MIWKHFIVASHNWETFGARRIANCLPIDCDANIFVTVEHCIQVWQVVALVILQSNACKSCQC
jgi:hypothetical protein